jgi:CRP-like cAMP-binding protein
MNKLYNEHRNTNSTRYLSLVFQNNFTKGTYIVRQGANGDTFYIISEGQVKVTKKVDGMSYGGTKFFMRNKYFAF